MAHDDLMQAIQKAAGLLYLSDMKDIRYRNQVMNAIGRRMRLLEYSLSAWEYAFEYIFDRPVKLESVDQLVTFVRDWRE